MTLLINSKQETMHFCHLQNLDRAIIIINMSFWHNCSLKFRLLQLAVPILPILNQGSNNVLNVSDWDIQSGGSGRPIVILLHSLCMVMATKWPRDWVWWARDTWSGGPVLIRLEVYNVYQYPVLYINVMEYKQCHLQHMPPLISIHIP